MHILVVDDEPFICATVSLLLKLEGHVVTTAADGRAGLQAALAHPPEVILSDINMPHMNGYQLLAAVRASPALDKTKVVLLTADADAGKGGIPGAQIADTCLAKPFKREQLLTLLGALEAGWSGPDSALSTAHD